MCPILCVCIPKVCLLVQQVHPLHHLWYETPLCACTYSVQEHNKNYHLAQVTTWQACSAT